MDIIAVRLTPKASSNRIGGIRTLPSGQKQIMVYVTSVAEKGKANEAMINLLAKYWNIAASHIHIIQGAKQRHKLIQIDIEK